MLSRTEVETVNIESAIDTLDLELKLEKLLILN